jgi:5-methylcytosine-specific restriction endonuclease McrA
MHHDNDNGPVRYGPWPTTADIARRLGTKTYFTWRPCKRGHLSPRWTSSNNCSECGYEAIRERKKNDQEYVIKMREYHKEYQVTRKSVDPEFLERCRENGRKSDRRPGRRARQNERRKERIATDPEFRDRINRQAAPARKRWKKNNPEARRIHCRTRRARMAGVGGTHTAAEVEAIHARQKFRCAECGTSTKKKRHVDHIIPIALGGSNAAFNLQILCPLCNDRKGAKHPIEFAKLKGRLL